jgi:hypothetical protein
MITVIKPRRSQPRPPGGILRRSYRVSRYTVTWTFYLDALGPGAVSQTNVQWSPDVPAKGELTQADFRHYRKGRAAIYQEVANIIGGAVAVAHL